MCQKICNFTRQNAFFAIFAPMRLAQRLLSPEQIINEQYGQTISLIAALSEIIPSLKEMISSPENRREEIAEAAEIKIKYKGYIEREKLVADKMHRLENIRIKGRFNYNELQEISTEGRQKLHRIDPETLAQASRIPGVSPSDINVLLVLLGR